MGDMNSQEIDVDLKIALLESQMAPVGCLVR